MLKLLDALDEKDVLIADLIEIAENLASNIDSGSERRACFLAINALKARAEK